MKKIFKLLTFLLAISLILVIQSCNEDEPVVDGPTIAAPAITNVQVGSAADVTFVVTVPGGFKSVTATATSGTQAVKSAPEVGASTGNVVITFTAGTTAGAGSVTILVTDNNDKTETETGTMNITALPVEPEPEVVVVSGVLSASATWTADTIYELAGRVIVDDGATLTINPGTVIKGREGQGINASVLMIARGGKINAIGTATEPIIMTTVLDDIMPGEISGTTLGEDDRGKWGGLVILGKAPISVAGATEAQIEGVPASVTEGLYGGADPADNSGTIKYVSIRHGGTVIAEGSEINGLTLGGVGSGTVISDIEIFANVDDGVELFGGSVSITNILIAYQGDDGIDIDQAYSGTVDGFLVVHGGDTDEGLEIDGPEGTENATGKFTLKNGTLKGDATKPNDVASLSDFKSKAQGNLENVIFTGYPAGKKIKIAASYATACAPGSSNAFSNLIAGSLVFITTQFTGYTVDVYSASTSNCAEVDVPAADQTAAEGKIVSATATGSPAITTWSWTISSEKSLLD
ncbi:MAG: right-handed parallel beta-helix repeat-containing protein [Bacteroidota bacterium]